jgi:hypothetical protein
MTLPIRRFPVVPAARQRAITGLATLGYLIEAKPPPPLSSRRFSALFTIHRREIDSVVVQRQRVIPNLGRQPARRFQPRRRLHVERCRGTVFGIGSDGVGVIVRPIFRMWSQSDFAFTERRSSVFGWHGLLERKLRKQGNAAWATVLSAQVTVPTLYGNTRMQLGALHQQRITKPRWTMVVRVEPGGEPPFDAEISGWLEERPRVVPVLYDPSDHRKVLLDKPAYEARNAAARRATPTYLLASGQRVRGVLRSFVDTATTAAAWESPRPNPNSLTPRATCSKSNFTSRVWPR